MSSALLRKVANRAVALRGLAAAAGGAGSLPERKVVVMGAAGGIGQPLSMLMKARVVIN